MVAMAWHVVVYAACTALVVLSLPATGATDVEVHVDTSKAVSRVPEYFRGFTCDWWRHNNPSYGDDWRMAGMLTLNLTSSRLKKMFQNLVPGLWRIGGTPEDEVVYVLGNPPECPPDQVQNSTNYPGPLCLTADRFRDIVAFANTTGVHLAFGLNGAYGRKDRHSNFNSTNAYELLRYAASLEQPIFAFELSNEKNGWDADKLAEDFGTVRGYINALWPDEEKRPLLVGPDTAAVPWLKEFFAKAGPYLNATTFHTYCNSYTTCAAGMLQPDKLDSCIGSAVAAINYTRASVPSKPELAVWSGEDGPHSGGGRPNCTDRFADAFWYLDHMATMALHGVQAFARSTMVGANYGMLNRTTFAPHPDYYAAYLWGKLMGRSHLSVVTSGGDAAAVRAYATCRAASSSVVVLLLNLHSQNVATVTIAAASESAAAAAVATGKQSVYMLRAAGGVNGMFADAVEFWQAGQYKLLELGADDAMPDLSPTVQPVGPIAMAPLSYAFVELDSAAGTCAA